jgi:hypothetical protein
VGLDGVDFPERFEQRDAELGALEPVTPTISRRPAAIVPTSFELPVGA